jgi:AraC-like DNA-binding protein
VRQRALFSRARNGELDPLAAEEGVIAIVAAVLGATGRSPAPSNVPARRAASRRRELAQAAKLELQRTVAENRSVHDIASSLGTSPFHLCRVFRAQTGRTLHEYRSELRVRLALEMFEPRSPGSSLSRIAHALGFSSHSHFVQAMRRHAGLTPRAARALVGLPAS